MKQITVGGNMKTADELRRAIGEVRVHVVALGLLDKADHIAVEFGKDAQRTFGDYTVNTKEAQSGDLVVAWCSPLLWIWWKGELVVHSMGCRDLYEYKPGPDWYREFCAFYSEAKAKLDARDLPGLIEEARRLGIEVEE